MSDLMTAVAALGQAMWPPRVWPRPGAGSHGRARSMAVDASMIITGACSCRAANWAGEASGRQDRRERQHPAVGSGHRRRSDAGRWEALIARVPAAPPPDRAAPGRAVYDIRVDDGKFLVGEHDLSGPLSDLVRAVLVEGDAVLAARPKPGTRGHGAATDPALGTGRYQVSAG
jgi:hypothetical protein